MKIFLSFIILSLLFCQKDIAVNFGKNDLITNDTVQVNKLLKQGFSTRLTSPTQAVEIGNKALTIAKKINYIYGIGEALRVIGIGNSYLDHTKLAIDNYLSALKYFQQINDLQSEAKVYNNIGNLYTNFDNAQALSFFNKALAIANKLANKKLIASVSLNMGVVYFRENNYKQALDYYNKSLKLFVMLKEATFEIICEQNIGVIYFNLKQYDKAYSLLSQANRSAKKLALNHTVASIDITLTELFILQNKFNYADKAIKEGLNYATLLKNDRIISNFRYYRYQLEFRRKNYKLALINLYTVYQQDSISHDKGITTQIDFIREQAKAEERKRENERLLEKQKLDQVKFLSAIAITILLIFSVGLLYSNVKRKAKTNIQLQALNTEVLKQKLRVEEINLHLEEIILDRTKELQIKNAKLESYSSYLSHQIRGPISSLKGLLMIEKDGMVGKQECIEMMYVCVNDIDKIILEINDMLNGDNDEAMMKKM
jgi:tetratricopeptide (TPR) repeat protein